MLVEAGPGTREIWPRLTRTWSQLDLDPSRWVPKGLLEHLGSLAAPVIHWSWGPAWPWGPSAPGPCRRAGAEVSCAGRSAPMALGGKSEHVLFKKSALFLVRFPKEQQAHGLQNSPQVPHGPPVPHTRPSQVSPASPAYSAQPRRPGPASQAQTSPAQPAQPHQASSARPARARPAHSSTSF